VDERSVPRHIFLVVEEIKGEIGFVGGEGGALYVGGVENEAPPLGFFAKLAHGLQERLVFGKTHPAGNGNEALPLLEIGNGGCHAKLYNNYSIIL
jgi:hypothetical protein